MKTRDMTDGYPGQKIFLVKRSGGAHDCVISVHRTESLARELMDDLNHHQCEFHYWVEKHAIRN